MLEAKGISLAKDFIELLTYMEVVLIIPMEEGDLFILSDGKIFHRIKCLNNKALKEVYQRGKQKLFLFQHFTNAFVCAMTDARMLPVGFSQWGKYKPRRTSKEQMY